jgi:hypothetical protein
MTDVQGNFDISPTPPTSQSGLDSNRLRHLLKDVGRGDEGAAKPDAVSEFLGTSTLGTSVSHGLDAASMSSDFASRNGTATAGSSSDAELNLVTARDGADGSASGIALPSTSHGMAIELASETSAADPSASGWSDHSSNAIHVAAPPVAVSSNSDTDPRSAAGLGHTAQHLHSEIQTDLFGDDNATDQHGSSRAADHPLGTLNDLIDVGPVVAPDHHGGHHGARTQTAAASPHPDAESAPAHTPIDAGSDHSITPSAPASTVSADSNATHADATHADASAAPPSIGTLIESGTKSILLATDASPTTPGPWTSAAAPAMPVQRGNADHGGDVTPNFAPEVLTARDQLASAIATASPQAAAITTLPPVHTVGVALPTLGGDVHAAHGHG